MLNLWISKRKSVKAAGNEVASPFFFLFSLLSVIPAPDSLFPLQHHHPVLQRTPWGMCWRSVLAVKWLWIADHKLLPKLSACGREGMSWSKKMKGKLKIKEILPNASRNTSHYHPAICQFESQWYHSHLWPGLKGAWLAMISGQDRRHTHTSIADSDLTYVEEGR